jgi:hypothetical protein
MDIIAQFSNHVNPFVIDSYFPASPPRDGALLAAQALVAAAVDDAHFAARSGQPHLGQ